MKNKKEFFLIILLVLLFENLNAATWNATKYKEEIVDYTAESCISTSNSIKLPYPGIALAYGGKTGLYYTVYNGDNNSWAIETIERGADIGKDISLQIDSSGNPHIAYTCIEKNRKYLKYVYYNSILKKWEMQIIDNDYNVGSFCSLQIDKNQNPHICYYDSNYGVLKYIYFNGVEWKKEIIDKSDKKNIGLYLSFKIDKTDNKHISYYNATDEHLRYAYYDGYNWNIDIVDSSGVSGLYSDLALDLNNKPYICYHSNGYLKCANNKLGRWNYKIVDIFFGAGMYNSKIIVDEKDEIHIFYYANYFLGTELVYLGGSLRYAHYSNFGWVIKEIKNNFTHNKAGNNYYGEKVFAYFRDDLYLNITQDINNELWLFYSSKEYFTQQQEYYYLIKAIRPEFRISNNWSSKKILNGNLGQDTLDLDNQGYPHIIYSYYVNYVINSSLATALLWHNWFDKNEWKNEMFDWDSNYSGYVYDKPILQIDSQNQLKLALYKKNTETNHESTSIYYFQKNGSTWSTEKIKQDIDKKGRFGFLLNNNDKPVISYYNSNSNLEICSQDNQNIWQTSIYDINYKADMNTYYPSMFDIAIDTKNQIHLFYSNSNNIYYNFQELNNWKTAVSLYLCNSDYENYSLKLFLKVDKDNKRHLIFRRRADYYAFNPISNVPYINDNDFYHSEFKYVSSSNGVNWPSTPNKIGVFDFFLSSLNIDKSGNPCFIGYGCDDYLYFYKFNNGVWNKEYIDGIGYGMESIEKSFCFYDDLPAFLLPTYNLVQGNYYLGLEYYAKIAIDLKIKSQIGNIVVFNLETRGPKGLKIINYLWNFEGTRGTDLITIEPLSAYTYTSSGTYLVRVTAVMEDGARIVAFVNVKIE